MSKTMSKFNFHLFLIFLIILLGISWFLKCFVDVRYLGEDPAWFARSGAILVCAAFFSALITRPITEEKASPDLVNIYQSALGKEKPKKPHWSNKFRIVQLLVVLELFIGLIGTVVWAYGDLWV